MHSIDELLFYADPEKIDLGLYEDSTGCILPNGLIFLRKNAPRKEQVTILLHELFHLHPDFLAYTQGLWNRTRARDEAIETAITQRAADTYIIRPDIVLLLEQRIAQAELLPINQRD